MTSLDYAIILAFLVFTVGLGLYFTKRASGSMKDFFVSGRNLTWWLAGTSMVAASFSSDTPLAVTEFVYEHGIAGNWYWWSFAIQGTMVTFLFSKMWRRAEILTDVEFFEFRYSGKSAAFLRMFKAFLGAVIANSIIMGWVILAMATILKITLDMDPYLSTALCVVLALAYSMASGLWGIAAADFFQFIVAMVGSIALTVFAVGKVGGLRALKTAVEASPKMNYLAFIPSPGEALFTTFLVYIFMQWWCASAADSGGGILVQRMLASKSPKESFKAMLWFNIAHYALRTWPWILCALCVVVLYPGLASPKDGYPMLIMDVLPAGWRGLMVASLLAAFMSTVDSSLSYASSYLSHDLYRRFLVKDRDEKHYVLVSRLCMVLVAVLAGLTSLLMTSVAKAWLFWTLLGAGAGLVKLSRWYWWRINAWSEISAMGTSLVFSLLLNTFTHLPYWQKLILNITVSTVVWVTVTFLTRSVDRDKLIQFYRKVRPSAFGWGPVAASAGPMDEPTLSLRREVLWWGVSIVFIYSLTFGLGKLALLEWSTAAGLLIGAAVSGALLYRFALR
jgi:Na+/proline symporter